MVSVLPSAGSRSARSSRVLYPLLAAVLTATLIFGCSRTPDDLPAGPDCALLTKTDLACIDYRRGCVADADCGLEPAACTKDGATSLAYAGGVCKSGNCGYSVTPTTCAGTCAAGVCPGDAGM